MITVAAIPVINTSVIVVVSIAFSVLCIMWFDLFLELASIGPAHFLKLLTVVGCNEP